jgi:hypothetical protein
LNVKYFEGKLRFSSIEFVTDSIQIRVLRLPVEKDPHRSSCGRDAAVGAGLCVDPRVGAFGCAGP